MGGSDNESTGPTIAIRVTGKNKKGQNGITVGIGLGNIALEDVLHAIYTQAYRCHIYRRLRFQD